MKLFGTGLLFGVPLTNSAGAAVAAGTPVQFATLQDIQGDFSFEEKLLYGAYQLPLINSNIMSDLFFGQASTAGIKAIQPNFAVSVPAASPYTLVMAPPSSGIFLHDMGVRDANTGLLLTKVAAAPATGQYECDDTTGTYTFAAADTNRAVLISYEYSATSTTGPRIIPITNQLMGYVPTFKAALNLSIFGKNATLVLNACASTKLTLPFKNDDYSISELDFSAYADASNTVGYIALSE
jgi:hypothetical protein